MWLCQKSISSVCAVLAESQPRVLKWAPVCSESGVTMRSFSILFKKNSPGLTKMRFGLKRALARFAPSQSSPAANPVSARPAPDISKKMRPKNGDKEGQIVLPRAAPRPTRAPGLWEGVRPRPGEGVSSGRACTHAGADYGLPGRLNLRPAARTGCTGSGIVPIRTSSSGTMLPMLPLPPFLPFPPSPLPPLHP